MNKIIQEKPTFKQLFNRVIHYRAYQQFKYQIAIHNEKQEILDEIKKYGHPLIKNVFM